MISSSIASSAIVESELCSKLRTIAAPPHRVPLQLLRTEASVDLKFEPELPVALPDEAEIYASRCPTSRHVTRHPNFESLFAETTDPPGHPPRAPSRDGVATSPLSDDRAHKRLSDCRLLTDRLRTEPSWTSSPVPRSALITGERGTRGLKSVAEGSSAAVMNWSRLSLKGNWSA